MSWFSDLKLRRKLAVGSAVKLAPFLATCGYLALALNDSSRAFDHLVNSEMEVLEASHDLSLSLVRVGRGIRMQHLAAKSDRPRLAEEVKADLDALKTSVETIGRHELTDAMRSHLEDFGQIMSAWRPKIETVLAAHEADRLPEALESITNTLPLLRELERHARGLTDAARERTKAQQETSAAAISRAQWVLVLGVLLTVVVVFVTIWRVARSISAPIDELRVKLAKIGDGDFTQRIAYSGKDEVGEVAAVLNETLEKLTQVLQEVRTVAAQVTGASTELHSSATEISAGASEQASGFEETAASLEEITSTVRSTSDNAQQASALSKDSRGAAENGQHVVDTAIDAMNELSASSRQIADIITTIDEIAFQTNLLALNAAVEAARAGEQGRGFAVVANEVRNLAQRSATAAKEIKGLINGSLSKVDSGVALVNQSGAALRGIVEAVSRVSALVGDISSASKEQSMGVDQVNKAVLQMDQVTQRNAAQTQELTATADRLTASAKHLEDTVSRFKLGSKAPRSAGQSSKPARKPLAPSAGLVPARPSAPTNAGFAALPPAPFPSGDEPTPPQGFQEF